MYIYMQLETDLDFVQPLLYVEQIISWSNDWKL